MNEIKIIAVKSNQKLHKKYEIATKDLNGDWQTYQDNIKTLKQAIKIASKLDDKEFMCIDINLIIDDDLKETYNRHGEVI